MVWGTLESNRNAPERLTTILGRQLADFGLTGEQAYELLINATTKEQVREQLSQLETPGEELQMGMEAEGIYKDLLGQEHSRMRKELFGQNGTPGKLEQRIDENSPRISIRFHVTKRRVHAVAGLNSGVCVVKDTKLWDNPDFLHVLFFNENNVSMGGMHLLIVEHAGKKYLTLPGINPSPHLLGMISAKEFLDAALSYAQDLARQWKLDGVWIPTDTVIHSNRPDIQHAIRHKFQGIPPKQIQETRFSYDPDYTFSAVHEILLPNESEMEARPNSWLFLSGAVKRMEKPAVGGENWLCGGSRGADCHGRLRGVFCACHSAFWRVDSLLLLSPCELGGASAAQSARRASSVSTIRVFDVLFRTNV
jgi:hypothetical protein